eukprot:13763195-Alexandrium_andersonii.AAC.1
MSASLVGSEMCIRDSPHWSSRRRRSRRWRGPRKPLGPAVLRRLRVEPAGCLLYTSDAADDM